MIEETEIKAEHRDQLRSAVIDFNIGVPHDNVNFGIVATPTVLYLNQNKIAHRSNGKLFISCNPNSLAVRYLLARLNGVNLLFINNTLVLNGSHWDGKTIEVK